MQRLRGAGTIKQLRALLYALRDEGELVGFLKGRVQSRTETELIPACGAGKDSLGLQALPLNKALQSLPLKAPHLPGGGKAGEWNQW